MRQAAATGTLQPLPLLTSTAAERLQIRLSGLAKQSASMVTSKPVSTPHRPGCTLCCRLNMQPTNRSHVPRPHSITFWQVHGPSPVLQAVQCDAARARLVKLGVVEGKEGHACARAIGSSRQHGSYVIVPGQACEGFVLRVALQWAVHGDTGIPRLPSAVCCCLPWSTTGLPLVYHWSTTGLLAVCWLSDFRTSICELLLSSYGSVHCVVCLFKCFAVLGQGREIN
jgi:hypothetical protein